MDKIFVSGMRFYAYHGVFPEENRLGQRFVVDVELGLDLSSAGKTDDLSLSVNYAEVYETVRREMTEKRVNLLETLAENIASALLSAFPVKEARVRVTKPDPPIPGHYDAVGVEIVRRNP
ncbi:dihydroneopterin aldolase [Staphylospora marina]|uniref:dihydroneopterin aldolase n=1 Tax=Staphylospora marina TaxID=2490858 RepID=UPI000F5BD9C2|nr:dihydroneopterin aldolase [Staphylospora marina]